MSDFTFDGKDYVLEDVSEEVRVLVDRAQYIQEEKRKAATHLDMVMMAESKVVEAITAALKED